MDFPLAIDLTDQTHIYQQLVRALKDAIASGRLQAGDFLPGTNELAQQLGVSRATVVRSYEELISQKYLESVTGIGTRVAASARVEPDASSSFSPAKIEVSSYAHRLMASNPLPLISGESPELNYGAGARELLPIKLWRQSLLNHCRKHDPSSIDYSLLQPFGYRPLREAISHYLRRSRGVICTADQVAVFPGSLDAVNLVARMLIDPGDFVGVENPGFPYARDVFRAHGAELVPLPTDSQGLDVEKLSNLDRHCKFIYITPSHQDPTGGVLSLERRKQLLEWADRTGTAIVEDDYDSEYRYNGPTLPSLQGMDSRQRVIYISTFWKVLFPISSAGYLVVPPSLVEMFAHAEVLEEANLSLLELQVLTDFVNEGHLDRHVKKSKTIYAKRLQTLISSLTQHLKSSVQIAKESAGTHLLVQFSCDLSEERMVALARSAKFKMASTHAYYLNDPPPLEFMVPFAHLDENVIAQSVGRFAELLNDVVQVAAT